MFSQILVNFREKNNITQQELIDKVNEYYDNLFTKLDTVTLSRWENGKTSPSLKKKILIIDFLDEIDKYLSGMKISENANSVLLNYIERRFQKNDLILSEIQRDNNKNFCISTSKLGDNKLLSKYLSSEIESGHLDQNNIKMISWSINKHIESCIVFTELKHKTTLFHKGSFVLLGMFAHNEIAFRNAFNELFNQLITTSNKYIYIYTYDDVGYNFLKKIKGGMLKSTSITDNKIKKRLFLFNRIDLISNIDLIDFYNQKLQR